jgi:DNA-binding LytR/AlgR family response regulator
MTTTTNENRVALKTIDGLSILDAMDIFYFHADGRYAMVYKADTPQAVKVYHSITEVEKTLPSYFFRCHRSYLVNLNHIVKVMGKTKSLLMRDLNEVPLSDEKVKFLKEILFKQA